MTRSSAPPVAPAIVFQHAKDAANAWAVQDLSLQSPQITWERYKHFDKMLDARLENLKEVGTTGLGAAFVSLQRWAGPGQAFVAAWMAACHQKKINTLSAQLRQAPDNLLRGVISALARMPSNLAEPLIHRWSSPKASPHEHVVALRGLALRRPASRKVLGMQLTAYMDSPSPFVRAAACRAGKALGSSEVDFLLDDPDSAVRAEAAITHFSNPKSPSILWQCVATQAILQQELTGEAKCKATRRLNRWVRHLAWAAPLGHKDLPTLFDFLPIRAGLSFALYHGDAAYLPRILAAMEHPETSRYAGWVWQTLTGVDLRKHGLIHDEPPMGKPKPKKFDLETLRDTGYGLPLPNADAISSHSINLPAGKRYLLGKELEPNFALDVLEAHSQPIRGIAAHWLTKNMPQMSPNIRSSVPNQQHCIRALNESLLR